MFRVKICGITSGADARAVVAAGADAIGLNFYSGSPRCVSLEQARQIVAVLPEQVAKIGVFVNSSATDVCRLFDDLGLSAIQLHGDEEPSMLAELGGRPVVRALRCPAGIGPAVEYVAACQSLGVRLAAVLVDSARPGQYGGTGETANWDQLANWRDALGDLPLILAGGLTPQNVGDAVRTVRPSGVDVASGVEVSPGHKSAALIEQFVTAARRAFLENASVETSHD